MVRALASLQCGPGVKSNAISGLSLLVIFLALRCFSPSTPVSPSPKSGHRFCFEFSSAGYSYHLEKSSAGYRYCLEISRRDITISWRYQLRDIAITWRFQERDIAIVWRYQVRDIVIVWRTLLITSLASPRATKRKRNKQTAHKKGQNSLTWPHKKPQNITLVLFIAFWGGSILLLSSCLMWIYFVVNTSRVVSAFFWSTFSLR